MCLARIVETSDVTFKMLNKNKIAVVALLAVSIVGNLKAGTWTNYAIGDVMLCFRKSGANDLVVNVGPVTNLTAAVMNKRIAISQYAGNQLALIGTNGVIWSAFTYFDSSVSPARTPGTLFISRGRNKVNTQTPPWGSYSQDAQLSVALSMSAIPKGAKDCISYNGVNTSSAVVEPDDGGQLNPNVNYTTGQSYSWALGSALDFGGTWEGSPEKTAVATFTTAGAVIRSDFYQINPNDTSDGLVNLLGYFEFNTNGAMTYVAYPTAPTVATVAASAIAATSAQLNATVTTINTNTDSTAFYFKYGLTTSYGSVTTVSNIGVNSGSYGQSVSGLTGGTAYHFQAVAYNQYGTNFGSDLTFTTSGGSPAIPVIKNIGRTNNITYVSFTTGNSGTYTLRGTNSLAIIRTNWPAISSIAGNGLTNTLQDTTSDSAKFYIITAQ